MPILAPDDRIAKQPAPPLDSEAQEVQEACNAYLNALIRGTREEQDEAGKRWDEMVAKKDGKNK